MRRKDKIFLDFQAANGYITWSELVVLSHGGSAARIRVAEFFGFKTFKNRCPFVSGKGALLACSLVGLGGPQWAMM
jgi:hypothetical protein